MTLPNAKAALKAARTALEAKEYDEAANQARLVLEADQANYFAHVFLGRALEKQAKESEAKSAYHSATKLKPDDEAAWKGLCSLSESSHNVEAFLDSSMSLALLYAKNDDLHQSQVVLDKAVALAREHGSRHQLKLALALYLPSCPLFNFLEGRIQSPALTYRRLAELTEAEDRERIDKEIGERRLRLGAKLSQVTRDVRREVFDRTELEQLFQEVINWTHDDEERLDFEEKLLQHAFEHLSVLPEDAKAQKRVYVIDLAHGMVILDRANPLAWRIELDWQDSSAVDESHRDQLLRYCQLFPGSGLKTAIEGFYGAEIIDCESPVADPSSEPRGSESQRHLSLEERLICFAEGPRASNGSPLAFQLAGKFYLEIEEYEAAVETARQAIQLLQEQSLISGLSLEHRFDATKATLGTALVYYQSPRNHPEALNLFNDVLSRHPDSTHALLGVGLIHEERHDFAEAASFLGRAQDLNSTSVTISAEAAWCRFLNGEAEQGLAQLQETLKEMEMEKSTPPDLRAKTSYRVGKCLWDSRRDKASRKERKGPYAFFISSLKLSPTFAPSYTALGLYYADYTKDKTRARQCFQKAFELSPAELLAAERLAQDFADLADWDVVEVIAKRAIESGVARPAPGSKRKAVSWPFAAMAIVQMNRQEYPLAVHSYHSALRISPDDYHSWIGLGESYLSSGRYNAASRVLDHAQRISATDPDLWFVFYLHANVYRELGDYERAISGYRNVLNIRAQEKGVSIALLQTLVESAQVLLKKGFFELSSRRAEEAIQQAMSMQDLHAQSVNFWKAVGDSLAILAGLTGFSFEAKIFGVIRELLAGASSSKMDTTFNMLDGIDLALLEAPDDTESFGQTYLLVATILAQKHAVIAAASDIYARSVAWYNLGWTEYLASRKPQVKDDTADFQNCARAATKCFKQAIEIESGNAEFWNALGVATTAFNPPVAQHCFVRSLHLNEYNAETWVNLAALYLHQQDLQLAQEAFNRAKSTEPDCAHAWLGEGMLALIENDRTSAESHFNHAMEICDASDLAVKRHFVAATYSKLANGHVDAESLRQTLLALQQGQIQPCSLLQYPHIGGLLQERAGDFSSAGSSLQTAADRVEQIFEETEEASDLAQFSHLKSDLARCQLALGQYDATIENASVALDLTDGDTTINHDLRRKLRLSAHLSSGIAHHRLGSLHEAIAMFRFALDESESEPDVICSLARVLWAQSAANERAMAKEQLFESLEKNPNHANTMILLAVMAMLDKDQETHKAVLDDLEALRCSASLTPLQSSQIEKVLRQTAFINGDGELREIQRSIILSPDQSLGWTGLAETSNDDRMAFTALEAASSVMALNSSAVEDVSASHLQVQRLQAVQQAVMLTPWAREGWLSIATALT